MSFVPDSVAKYFLQRELNRLGIPVEVTAENRKQIESLLYKVYSEEDSE